MRKRASNYLVHDDKGKRPKDSSGGGKKADRTVPGAVEKDRTFISGETVLMQRDERRTPKKTVCLFVAKGEDALSKGLRHPQPSCPSRALLRTDVKKRKKECAPRWGKRPVSS